MSINILKSMTYSTLDSAGKYAEAAAEEHVHLLEIQACDKAGTILGKTSDVLEYSQKVTSRFPRLDRMTRALSNRIQKKSEENNQKKKQAEEERAWSTLEKHLHGTIAQVQASATATTGIGIMASDLVDSMRNEDRQESRSTSRTRSCPCGLNCCGWTGGFDPLPSGSVPISLGGELPLPRDMRIAFPVASFNSLPLLPLPQTMPDLGMPSLSIPSVPELETPSLLSTIPHKAVEKLVDMARKKVVDKGISLVEEQVTQPIATKEEEFDRLVETHLGKKGTECTEAVKIIYAHRTEKMRRGASECWGKVQTFFHHSSQRCVESLCH